MGNGLERCTYGKKKELVHKEESKTNKKISVHV